VLALPFQFFQNFYPATYAIEESFNGSELKAGHSIPMFNDNLFDFTLASRVSDREELAAIVVSTRGNLGTVAHHAITALATGFYQPFMLAGEILCLLLWRYTRIQGSILLGYRDTIRYRQELFNLGTIIATMPASSTVLSQFSVLEPPMQDGLGEPILLLDFRLPQQHQTVPH